MTLRRLPSAWAAAPALESPVSSASPVRPRLTRKPPMRTLCLGMLCLLISATAYAQIPGPNVNMVTGKTFPGGDPNLQKQNEPSLAISTRNPCRLLGGANDYRAVNLPGLPADKENGDAWVGWYTSIDCGQTWYSTLVPGYLQDQSPAGLASPVKGLTTGADPTVRAGAGGFFAYSFIAFNRGSNVGKLAVARFIDKNNKEAITKAENAITYIDTKVWDTGSAGQFIDKPVVLVTPGTGTCSVSVPGSATPIVIPASVVHMAWTVFVGNNQNVTTDTVIRTKVYYARSSNCGATLDFPATKLSEGYATNQGASIGVTPNGNVFVVWRQVHSPKGDLDQILFAKSVDGGKSFTKALPIPFITPTFTPFDQGTTSKTFRTTAFPTAAVDPSGRLYVAVAVRGFADANQSRIVVTSTTDGINWTMPQAVENLPQIRGHQIMPAMTAVGGKLNLVWLDFRDDVSEEDHDFIQEIYPIRHTMDVRGAQSPLNTNGALSWTTYGILQTEYPPASLTPPAPRISRYLTGNYPGNPSGPKQLQFNRPNLKLYAGGTRPFVGDYIDIAGLAMIGQHASPQAWLPNDGSSGLTAALTFYAAWTDNRDAKVGPALPEPIADPTEEEDDRNKVQYAAPGSTCTPAQANLTGTRDANVYEARISPGVFVAAPANSKPSISGDQRAFSVLVQNNTVQNAAGKKESRTFRLHIDNQPTGGAASFVQFPYQLPLPPPPQKPVLATPLNVTDTIFVSVPPKSSITRTVYVVSTEKYPQIRVSVTEQGVPPGTAPLAGAALLNPDVENPDVENPDVENPDVENQGVANAEVHNPDVENPDVENPDVENPDVENPDVENPDVENPDVENPDVENPDVENPDVENPDVENPDVENPDVENPDVENSALTDFSVDVTNNGNTTGTYQIKFAVGGDTSGYVYQVIGRRVYKTPTANGCELTEKAQNQILFNITNPDLSPGPLPDGNDGSESNATVVLKPREKIKVTLRAFDKDYFKVVNPNKLGGNDGVVQPFCATASTTGSLCPVATNPVDVIVRAGSANTGETAPRTDVFPTNPDGDLAITTTTVNAANLTRPYRQQLNASGGLATNYSWSLAAGSLPLPAGLTLNARGFISGTPTANGSFPFTAKVTDGVQSDTQALTLLVGNGTTLSVATTALPGGFVGTFYNFNLDETGGTAPFTWSVVTGTLPSGLTLSPSGYLSGTPTQAIASTFTVQVVDATQNTASKALTLTTMTLVAGDLIVADGTVGTTNGKLYRLTKDGATIQLIADIGGRPQSIAQDDGDGSIIVVDSVSDRVLRVTPGNVTTLFSGSPLSNPVAVAILPGGEVVIGDNATDKLYRLSIDGESVGISELASLPVSATELQGIQIAFDPATGKLFVTDDAGLQVRLITIQLFGETPPTTVLVNGVRRAGGLAINDQGNLVIADFTQQKIFTVKPDGTVLNGLPAPTGTNMVGLGINSDNNYYVAVNFANAVKKVTTAGTVTNVHVGKPFTYPTDLIVYRPAGDLFALLSENLDGFPEGPQESRIEIVDLPTRSSVKTIPLGSRIVSSLAVSPDKQTIYVGDLTNGAVLAVNAASGNIDRTFQATQPRDLALSADGTTLYVANGTSLLKINTTTGFFASLSVADTFLGIALSPDGTRIAAAALTTDTSNHWLYLIDAETLHPDRVAVTVPPESCGPYPNDVAFTNTGRVLLWDAGCDALYQFQVSTEQQLGTTYLPQDGGTFVNYNNMLSYSTVSGRAYALKEDAQFEGSALVEGNHLAVVNPADTTFAFEDGFSGQGFVPALSADGKTLAVSVMHRFGGGSAADTLDLLDVSTNTWDHDVFTFGSPTMSVRDMKIVK